MGNYVKVKNEFDQKLSELKKEINPSIYASDLNEIEEAASHLTIQGNRYSDFHESLTGR